MVMTFQEFLERRANQQQHRVRRERREEWIAAVGRLMDQLRAWLAEADPASVLDVIPITMEKAEPGLGIYSIPGLKISLGNAAVQVVPIGRNAVGHVGPQGDSGMPAEGRVDITDGVRKYILYRTLENRQDKWHALDEHFQARPLDRGQLEAILQDLLS
jgi:hypothetical protein